MNPIVLFCVVLLACGLSVAPAWGKVTVDSVFGSNMVLQREQPVRVRGAADPGERVTVRFAGQEKSGAAGADGRWMLTLDPLPVSREPRTMTIAGSASRVELQNILVGDVWLCVGQSNMAFQLAKAKDGAQEAAAADYPEIRIFGVHFNAAREPREQAQGEWAECRPKRAAKTSAVAYFFARDLHRQIGVPIGLMGSSLSGSYAEVWMSREAQLAHPYTRPYLEAWDWLDRHVKLAGAARSGGKGASYVDEAGAPVDLKALSERFRQWKNAATEARKRGRPLPEDFPAGFAVLKELPRPDNAVMRPTGGFNGAIAPLTALPIKGAVWYQGESHLVAADYGHVLARLIADWRARFGVGDFPFLVVGLPNWKGRGRIAQEPVGGTWPWVREQQFAVAKALPNVFVTVNTDTAIPDQGDLHPTNKQPVGERLARLAAARVYGQTGPAEGPVFEHLRQEGDRVRLTFRHAEDGLMTIAAEIPGAPANLPQSPVRGFAIAGPDRKWKWADATIEGNEVVLSADGVEPPVAVRYNWADYPVGNLFGKSGLPAAPFRTDDWQN
ncbi:MAG TPA: sialate O-acetylesterase [Opitutaceae bacterium]